jgi:preprotein translocase subunit SecA
MLQVLDNLWKEHLGNMDHLRQGINLRAYAQKNPKQEYKRESFELFRLLLDNIKAEVVQVLFRIQIASKEEIAEAEERNRLQQENLKLQHASASALSDAPVDNAGSDEQQSGEASATPFVREGMKVGRNEPCPCGSGKKYKQCHGSLV